MISAKIRSTMALTAALFALVSAPTEAAETYSFPSPGGAQLGAAPTPQFAQPATESNADVKTGIVSTSVGSTDAVALSTAKLPVPVVTRGYGGRFGRSDEATAYAYRFLTHALASQSFSNYAADYYRLFTPGYAVSTWTDRVYGMVDVGYGSVDGWTAGVYMLPRVGGRSYGRDSSPDLSVMPKFRSHPELEKEPTFLQQGN
jgi:hypothetical protein